MIDVICLNGPPGSGKDFIGEMLYKTYPLGCELLKFAAPIEDIAKAILGYDDDLFQLQREQYKDEMLPGLNFTMRELMIDISENFIKPKFGQHHFGKLAAIAIDQKLNLTSRTMIFTDSGFQAEFDTMQELLNDDYYNLHLVNIFREGKNFDNDSREYVTNKKGKTIRFDNNVDKSDFVNFVENSKNLMIDLGLI